MTDSKMRRDVKCQEHREPDDIDEVPINCADGDWRVTPVVEHAE